MKNKLALVVFLVAAIATIAVAAGVRKIMEGRGAAESPRGRMEFNLRAEQINNHPARGFFNATAVLENGQVRVNLRSISEEVREFGIVEKTGTYLIPAAIRIQTPHGVKEARGVLQVRGTDNKRPEQTGVRLDAIRVEFKENGTDFRWVYEGAVRQGDIFVRRHEIP